jgi:3-hydroxyethyl bacteriochlorophyllide a dehydrogenase
VNGVAVLLKQPESLGLERLTLQGAGDADVVVDVAYSGISTGTERLLYTGAMPPFPGMGYPLVPGYESVGRVVAAGPQAIREPGEWVFVPGARCFGDVRSLFGATASRLVVPSDRVVPVSESLGEKAVLLALAATAYHAVAGGGRRDPIIPPQLIIGHGVLGRLLARMTVAAGFEPPVVWETQAERQDGAQGYSVVRPEDDDRRDYRAVYDVSGDPRILDAAIARVAKGGEVVLAGFYSTPLSFQFAPAFMREAQIRTAAEWQRPDMLAVKELAETGRLNLDGLITHEMRAQHAHDAYRTAFGDAGCLKMVLDWSSLQ